MINLPDTGIRKEWNRGKGTPCAIPGNKRTVNHAGQQNRPETVPHAPRVPLLLLRVLPDKRVPAAPAGLPPRENVPILRQEETGRDPTGTRARTLTHTETEHLRGTLLPAKSKRAF